MSATSSSKQRSTTFLTCSGSSISESAVKPTRSAKRTVTTLRSSVRRWIAYPQDAQKRAPSAIGARHDGQFTTSPLHHGRIVQGEVGSSPFFERDVRPSRGKRSDNVPLPL